MKITKIFFAIGLLATCIGCVDSVKEKHESEVVLVPKMKMMTTTPDGIATPNKLDTRIGELNFFDGVPEKETELND